MPIRNLVLASHNLGKIEEFRRLFAPVGIGVEVPGDYATDVIEEVGDTYFENARLKACAVAQRFGVHALADDSGIEVDALDGKPGVRSARFVGHDPWENSREILLRLMGVALPERGARMVAALVVVGPDGREVAMAEGEMKGMILTWPRGVNGFGFDPIFSVDGGVTSLAEWSDEAKDRISHRGQAVRRLATALGLLDS